MCFYTLFVCSHATTPSHFCTPHFLKKEKKVKTFLNPAFFLKRKKVKTFGLSHSHRFLICMLHDLNSQEDREDMVQCAATRKTALCRHGQRRPCLRLQEWGQRLSSVGDVWPREQYATGPRTLLNSPTWAQYLIRRHGPWVGCKGRRRIKVLFLWDKKYGFGPTAGPQPVGPNWKLGTRPAHLPRQGRRRSVPS